MNAKKPTGEIVPVALSKGNWISVVSILLVVLGAVWSAWGSVTNKQAAFEVRFDGIDTQIKHVEDHIEKNEAKAETRFKELRDLIIEKQ